MSSFPRSLKPKKETGDVTSSHKLDSPDLEIPAVGGSGELPGEQRWCGGNPPEKALTGEVEISRREFLHEEVQVFR